MGFHYILNSPRTFVLKAFKLAILVFPSSNFLLTTSLFVFAVDILPCMCLAALWSSVGKGAKAVVAGPAGAAFAGPTFWPSMLSTVFLYLVLVLFSLSLPLILFNHSTIY